MKAFIYILFCFLYFMSFAQKRLVEPPVIPFESLTFNDFNPTWTFEIFDSTLVRNDTFNGYNEFDFVYTYGDHFRDGKLYKSHTIRNYDWMGFTVNCIDVATGLLLWVRKIEYADFGRQLLPHYQTFDDDGNLVIIGFRKAFPYNKREWSWWSTSETPNKIFRLVINSQDGKVISYNSPDDNPNYVYAVNVATDRWTFFGLDTLGSVEFLFEKYNETPVPNSLVQRGFISTDGRVDVRDSLIYSPENWKISRTRYAKRHNKYYTMERSTIDKKKYIVEMDSNLVELSRVDVSYLKIEDYNIEMEAFGDEYMLYSQAFPSQNNYNYRYFVVDYSGNLKNVMDFDDEFYKKYLDANITFDKKYKKLLVIAYGNDRNIPQKELKRFWEVLHYDGKEYELLKRIEVSQKNKDISPHQILYVDDEHFIFDCRLGAFYFENNSFKRYWGYTAVALMSVSRSDLGMISSINELDEEQSNSYFAYPNPSTGSFYLSIAGHSGSKDIRLFDMTGRNVYVDTEITTEDIQLDLSGLPAGNYVYKVYQGSNILTSGQWVKM